MSNLVSIDETADLLDVSKSRVHFLMANNRLHWQWVYGQRKVDYKSIIQYKIERNKRPNGGRPPKKKGRKN